MEGEERVIIFQAHAEYFLDFAKAAESQLMGAEQVNWVNLIELEYNNLRAALAWFIKTGESEKAMLLGCALGRFWHIRGRLREGREWLEKVLKVAVNADQRLQAKVLCWIGILAYTQGDYNEARRSLNRSLSISHKLEDQRIIADALYFLGVINRIQNDYSKAMQFFEESLRLCDNLNDKHGVGNALINLGIILQAQGNNTRALQLFEESLNVFQQLAYKRGIAYASLKLGSFTHTQKHSERGWKFLKESLSLSHELGDKWSVAYALSGLARFLCSEGKYAQSGRIQGAVRLLLDELGTELEPFEEAEYNRTATNLKATLGESRYFDLFQEGKTFSLEKAIELAIQNA
jgi:tetratricopeptide (TPR) repeat protein